MGKRKGDDGDSALCNADSSNTVSSSDVINAPNLCDTSKDEYDIWLVRKPRRVCLLFFLQELNLLAE